MYVVEATKTHKNEHDAVLHERHMVGPFSTFEEAHEWMEMIGAKEHDTLIIHELQGPSTPPR